MTRADRISVIVTDAPDRKALAAIRSLGRLGFRVAVAGAKKWDRGFFSKYCAERLICPSPSKSADDFASWLLEVVAGGRFDCVMPMSDYTTIPLSRYKRELEKHTCLAVPDYEVLTVVRNKPGILKIASRLGIGTPRTWCPSDLEEVEELAGEIAYPCVVKYKKGTGAIGVRYAHTPGELLRHFQTAVHKPDVVFDDIVPMVQEYIPGGIHDVCLLFNNGRVRAAEVHERTRMYPASGGYGVTYETRHDPQLKADGIRLLEEVGWHGPALVEFKKDPRTGAATLMEVNTRFWGGLDVSAHAGIDFVHLAVRMAIDGDVDEMYDYRHAMKYRWVAMELRRALESSHPFSEMLNLCKLERGAKCDLSLSDPFPHIVETALALGRPVRRLVLRNRLQ